MKALEKARQAREELRAAEAAAERTLVARDGCSLTVFVRVIEARCGHGLTMRERR